MVLKFFGRDQGGIDYLLNNTTARVLKGSPELIQFLLTCPPGRGQRFLAGVLSAPLDTPDPVMKAARWDLEFQLRAGLPPQSLLVLWVEHRDKGRQEDHFIVLHLELLTRKKYYPYIDRIDRHRMKYWMEHFNLHNGLPDDGNRLRVKPDYTRQRLATDDKDFLMKVWETVDKAVRVGIVTNRYSLIEFLRAEGHSIRPVTHAGNPLEQPVIHNGSGKPLRLRGSVYYHKDFSPELLCKLTTRPTPEETAIRLEVLRKEILAGLEFRAHHTIGRLFGQPEQHSTKRGAARTRLQQLMDAELQKNRQPQPAHPFFEANNLGRIFRTAQILKMLKKSVEIIGTDAVRKVQPPALKTSGPTSPQVPGKKPDIAPPPVAVISEPEIHLTISPPSQSENTQKRKADEKEEAAVKPSPLKSKHTIHPASGNKPPKGKKRIKSPSQPSVEPDQSHEMH